MTLNTPERLALERPVRYPFPLPSPLATPMIAPLWLTRLYDRYLWRNPFKWGFETPFETERGRVLEILSVKPVGRWWAFDPRTGRCSTLYRGTTYEARAEVGDGFVDRLTGYPMRSGHLVSVIFRDAELLPHARRAPVEVGVDG